MRRAIPFSLLSLALVAGALAQDPDALVSAAQTSADEIRTAAGTDLAFVAAGLFKDRARVDSANLAANLLFPTDEIVILSLTGAQLRQAFERSLVFYPQPNSSFLYFSGATVTFDRTAASGGRVTAISTDAGALEDAKTYRVAMPASLGNGGLGYFKVWDAKNIAGKAPGTIESVLSGKRATPGSSRWLSRP